MTAIKSWMDKATVAEQDELAVLAGTSRGYLLQLKGGHRKPSAAKARKLDEAAQQMHREKPHLPLLPRAQLCPDAFGTAE